MLIPPTEFGPLLSMYGITGILHIGAHDCEENPVYESLGINTDSIIWIDAIQGKVDEGTKKGHKIYQAVITEKDDDDVTFNISNNHASSSILDFGTHSQEHPYVVYVDKFQTKSITVDTFFERNKLDASNYTFWNFDIQGAELSALKGSLKSLVHAKVLYLEVNEKELYKGCALIGEIDSFLSQQGFSRYSTAMTIHGWGDAIYIRI